MTTRQNVWCPDADIESADWTKQSWDLPPYKSPEFLIVVPDLEAFRKLPVYKHAVQNGLIMDDEWVKQKGTALAPQIIGNAGLYYCCYQLSRRGWNVMPTARNARGVDLIAYSQDTSRMMAIQVKSLSKRHPVPIGASCEKVMGDFWIIVNKVASNNPSAFILLPTEVRKFAHRGEKEGKVSFWLQPTAYDQDQFREKWERIGHGSS